MTTKALYGTALLLTLLSFLLVPGRPLEAADCARTGGSACTMTCTGFWIWKKCQYKTFWDLI